VLISDNGFSTWVDFYHATNNSWTSNPSGLGQARGALAAAALASGLVFFAGGGTTGIAKNAAIDCTMSV
jgi:hypothetical protein